MRHRNLTGAAILMFLLALAPAALPAEKSAQTQPQSQPQTEVTVTYEIFLQGTYSGYKDSLQQVIQNAKDFEDLWKKHVSVLVPQPPLPEVDFETQCLVAIYMGEKTTSGYQIRLRKVEAQGDNVVVHYHQTEPPANSLTLQVLTQPFLILKVNKPKGQVQIVKE